jgi:hypothetical protein
MEEVPYNQRTMTCDFDVIGSSHWRSKCKNTSFDMSDYTLLQCCSDNINKAACMDGYCMGSEKCATFMGNFCKGGKAMYEPLCKKWCDAYPAQCFAARQEYCNTLEGIRDPDCKTWAMSLQTLGNPHLGACDDAVRQYCATEEGKQDKFCDCVNSPAKEYNPLCIDAKCALNGYPTAALIQARGAQCPNVVDCKIVQDFKAKGGIVLDNVTINQNCGNNSADTPITTTPATQDDHSLIDAVSKNMNTILMVFLFILFVVIAIMSAAVFVMPSEASSTKRGGNRSRAN